MKINPVQFLSEEETYIQNFWSPHKGNKVVYVDGNTYTIKEIINDQAILEELPNRAIWLQDLGWKPILDDCDNIVGRFNAQVIGNQIIFKTEEQKCFFEKPSTICGYRDLIMQLRVLNKFQEVS